VRLDIDAKKSILIHPAGKSGKCIFRPVVFVDVHRAGEREECPQEFSGTIRRIEEEEDDDDDEDEDHDGDEDDEDDDGHGDVEDRRSSGHDDGEDGDDDLELVIGLGRDRGSVRVEIESDTAIFGADALPGNAASLKVDDRVLVRGETERDGEIEAIWVIQGEPKDLRGTFQSGVAEGRFTFLPDGDGQSAVSGRTTEGTLAFPECEDDPVALSIIALGTRGRILGAEVLDGDETVLRAAVIDIGPSRVRGTIEALDRLVNRIDLKDGPSFRYDGDTAIVLVGDGSLSEDDLQVGQAIAADLDAERSRASKIAVEPEVEEGIVDLFDPQRRTFILLEPSPAPEAPAAEVAVVVARGATVLLIEDDEIHQVDLSALQNGDEAAIFGLRTDDGMFKARTVVIRR